MFGVVVVPNNKLAGSCGWVALSSLTHDGPNLARTLINTPDSLNDPTSR